VRDGRALLGQAIREEKQPQVCREHHGPVYYDEPMCPCCKIESELKIHRWNVRRVAEMASDERRREADRELRKMSSKFTP
jgi:hypothetical protein